MNPPCSACEERKRIIREAKAQGKSWAEIIRLIAEHAILYQHQGSRKNND